MKRILQVKVNQIKEIEEPGGEVDHSALDDAVAEEGKHECGPLQGEPSVQDESEERSSEVEDSPLLKELVGALKIDSKDKIDEVRELLKRSEDKKSDKHLTKKARAAKRAAKASEVPDRLVEETTEEDLTWEDKDILRGLGVKDLHHVSSTVSVQEMVSKAATFHSASRKRTKLSSWKGRRGLSNDTEISPGPQV